MNDEGLVETKSADDYTGTQIIAGGIIRRRFLFPNLVSSKAQRGENCIERERARRALFIAANDLHSLADALSS